MDEELKQVADAMGVSVEDARHVFESVGPVNTLQIVRGLAVDRRTERAIEEAARTDEQWWRPDKAWWEQ